MSPFLQHLIVVPVVLPLLTAALLLLFDDIGPRAKSIINIGATLAGLLIALEILRRVEIGALPGAVGVYLAANWEAPFGIVLVADRLSALMLVLTGVISLGAAAYATAAWSRAGVYFHALFQIQLMGLNGAFLTGDLFNLFVFFEVMLAASYGLQLHGSGWRRVRSGLHYIAVNLLASSLFLVGLAMIYGVMGTLSMADVAAKVRLVPASDRGLLHAAAAILAMAFLTKAAIWPLSFWLVPAYTAASAPVAALFALMTKVGIYALLRVWTLMFSADAGASAHFGAQAFVYAGLVTGVFGILGLMASLRLGRVASFSIIVSSGTLLGAIGIHSAAVTASALFYLLSATLAVSALFLLVEIVERPGAGSDRVPLADVNTAPGEDTNLDDEEAALVGRVIPVPLALLGLGFIACALLIAGLPPLSGFVAKFALARALLNSDGLGSSSMPGPLIWSVFALLLISGLATMVSMTRTGIRHFWTPQPGSPRLTVMEGAPIIALIASCAVLTAGAEPVIRYTTATAEALHSPRAYIEAVLSTKPLPSPTRPGVDREVP